MATSPHFSKRPNGIAPFPVDFCCCHMSEPPAEDARRIYGPCSVFCRADTRASGNVCLSATRRSPDTARRASEDATAASLISWTLFP